MTNPHTTIIIPYNTDRGFLADALKSAHAQPNCTVIESHSPHTVGHNVNLVLRNIKTKYWCQLDEDDILTPNSVQNRIDALVLSGKRWIHGRAVNFFPNGQETPYTLTNPNVTFESCIRSNGIFGSSGLYETSLCEEVGFWDTELTTGEEWEWHLRLMKHGHMPAFCDSVVYRYRRHAGQKSLGAGVDQLARKRVHNEIRERYESK